MIALKWWTYTDPTPLTFWHCASGIQWVSSIRINFKGCRQGRRDTSFEAPETLGCDTTWIVFVCLCKENIREKNGCNWNRPAVSHIAGIIQSCRNVLSRYYFLMFMEWCQSQQVTNSAQKLGCLFPDCRSDDLFWILGCLRNLLPTCQVMATFVVLQGILAMWMCLEGAMSCFEWLSLTWSHMVPWTVPWTVVYLCM